MMHSGSIETNTAPKRKKQLPSQFDMLTNERAKARNARISKRSRAELALKLISLPFARENKP